MEKIRVLQIGMYDHIGGIETYLMNYYRNINKNMIQFDFINMYNHLCFETEIKELGGRIYNVCNVKNNPIKYCIELYNILINENYKIVHINMLSAANILPILISKLAKIPNIIIHSHNSNIPKGMIRKILHLINKNIINKLATIFWACSETAGKWLFGNKVKFEIINNAISIREFKYDEKIRENIRKKLKLENKFVIGHVGRFSEQKNHIYIIKVFQELLKKENNAILLLVGSGGLLEKFEKMTKEMRIDKKIMFIGEKNNIEKYYQAMDIFILPSQFEGFPVVGIEAQVNGLPCIFSNTITKEIKCNKNIEFIGISDKEIRIWTDTILKMKKSGRNFDLSNIKKYDIKQEAVKLQEKYMKMMENYK